MREFLAELLGTFMLVLLGDGAVAQVVLGQAARQDQFFGNFLSISLGYGLALMLGILVSGGVSGGHLNPAVTTAMAAIRKLEMRQIPHYLAAQYLGAFCGALVLWGEYSDIIRLAETKATNSTGYTEATRGIFASYPTFPEEVGLLRERIETLLIIWLLFTSIMPWHLTRNACLLLPSLALDQMLGTGLLVVIVLAATDGRNMKLEAGLVPLTIGLGLTAIHLRHHSADAWIAVVSKPQNFPFNARPG